MTTDGRRFKIIYLRTTKIRTIFLIRSSCIHLFIFVSALALFFSYLALHAVVLMYPLSLGRRRCIAVPFLQHLQSIQLFRGGLCGSPTTTSLLLLLPRRRRWAARARAITRPTRGRATVRRGRLFAHGEAIDLERQRPCSFITTIFTSAIRTCFPKKINK